MSAFALVAFCSPPIACEDSDSRTIEGKWFGVLNITESEKLRVLFEIDADPNGGLQATLVSLDQGSIQIEAEEVSFEHGVLRVKAITISKTFEGRLNDNGLTIDGTFGNDDERLPLILKRIDDISQLYLDPDGSQPKRLQKLRSLVEDGRIEFPSKGDFSFFLPYVKDKRIIFIAEFPHKVYAIKSAAWEFAVFLASGHGASVFAKECAYGLHPIFEEASMGRALPSQDDPIPTAIRKYNESVADEEKLLVTAIDIEHTINRGKPETVRYLNYLADSSSSSSARNEIKRAIPRLLKLKERKDIHEYLDTLEDLFARHRDTFSSADWEEIDFSFELMRASVDHQLLPSKPTAEFAEIRGEYFRETIKRAYEKAKKRGGSLLCYVGGEHASKAPHQKGDEHLGKRNEAEFFHTVYPETKGKVASILITPLTYRGGTERYPTGDVEDIAYLLSGDEEQVFISLSGLADHAGDLSWSRYFTTDGPKYDGILFVKNVPRP